MARSAAKHLALGGAHEAAFSLDGPFARAALAALAPHAGCVFHDTTCSSEIGRAPVAAFALKTNSALALWIANLTPETQALEFAGLAPIAAFNLHRLHATSGPAFREFPGGFTDERGGTTIRLTSHEVCVLQLLSS